MEHRPLFKAWLGGKEQHKQIEFGQTKLYIVHDGMYAIMIQFF